MLNSWTRIFGGLCLAVGMAAASAEGAGTTGAEFLCAQVPAGPAAQAAGTAASGGSEMLAWNPAGIGGQAYPSLSFTHFVSFADIAYEQLEGVLPHTLTGNWAMRFFYANTNRFMQIDESGNEVGVLADYDLMGHAAYARSLNPGLEAGIAVKMFESTLAGLKSRGVALDAGIQYRFLETPLTLAAAILNWGSMTAFDQEADPLPLLFAAGLALALEPWEGHAFHFLADLNCPLVGDEAVTPAVGLEYQLQNFAVVRGGYRFYHELGTLTLGGGLRWSAFGVDYAFQPYGTLGNSHRLTLSYYIKPAEPFLPSRPLGKAVESAAPEAMAEEDAPAKAIDAFSETDIAPLTVLPRDFDGKVIFRVAQEISGPAPLVLEIRDAQNQRVKTLPLPDVFPAEVEWNGQDEQGNKVSSKRTFYYLLKTAAGTSKAYALPQFTTVVKLRFLDGSSLEPEAGFEFLVRPEVQKWSLTLHDRQGGRALRTLAEPAELPQKIVWDGTTQEKVPADSRAVYAYQFSAAYANRVEVRALDTIQPVEAKKITSPSGRPGILIPGILFDFNSAVLKPEMTDKLVAAAGVLKRHPGRARAICEGHADEIGSRAYNQKISEQRAYMVARFLSEQLGAGREVLVIKGFGKDRPESLEKTEEGRSRNRRVEIRLWLEP